MLPLAAYEMETTTLTVKSGNVLRTTERARDRITLEITPKDPNINTEIRCRTKVDNIAKFLLRPNNFVDHAHDGDL